MGKRGIRQRLDLDSQPSSSSVPADPENPPKRGGIKRRVETSSAQPSIQPAAKGGIRKRLEKAGATSDVDHALEDAPKPFNKTMRQDWSRGIIGARQVLKYCSDAAAQGAHGLGRLADHTTLKNAHRDLIRALGWPESAPPLEWIEVPKGEKGFLLPHPILKPTCVFEHLVKVDEERFNRLIRGPEGDISDYWGNLRGHACVEAIREFLGPKTVPIAMHGDGAATHKTEGLFTVSWASNTVRAPTIESKIIFTTIRKGREHHKVS